LRPRNKKGEWSNFEYLFSLRAERGRGHIPCPALRHPNDGHRIGIDTRRVEQHQIAGLVGSRQALNGADIENLTLR
jgi:hypothetical protein